VPAGLVPPLRLVVAVGRGDGLAIGTEGHALHVPPMWAALQQDLTGPSIAHDHLALSGRRTVVVFPPRVAAPGEQTRAVRAEGNAVDLEFVARPDALLRAAGRVPDAHRAVLRHRRQPLAIRAEGQPIHL